MILEALLIAIQYVLFGIISLLPRIPIVKLDFLDGVFQLLSLADLLIDVRVFAGCLVTVIMILNIDLIWAIIMWVVRKIPGVD